MDHSALALAMQEHCPLLTGDKICIRGNHDGTPARMHKIGFLVVLESAFIKIGRHSVELVHAPSQPAPPHFQLHGHVHDKRPNKLVEQQLNLSVEVWDYKPVSEKTIVALLDRADHLSTRNLSLSPDLLRET
jgi:calcineurin-like phosphoesterase family protein